MLNKCISSTEMNCGAHTKATHVSRMVAKYTKKPAFNCLKVRDKPGEKAISAKYSRKSAKNSTS
jgi:hypothetical protein